MSTKINRLVRLGKIGPIYDHDKDVWVNVTKMDILRAKRYIPDQCAFAKACNRLHPNAIRTFFFKHAAYIALVDPVTGKEWTLRFIPSPEARAEIIAFDKRGTFTPGRYKLLAPTGSTTLAEIHKRSKKRPGRHQPGKAKKKIKRKVKVETRTRQQWAAA